MCGSTLILFQAPAIILGQGSSFASCSVGVFNNLKYRCKPLAYMVFLWVPVNFCHPLARNARESNMSWMKKPKTNQKKKKKNPNPTTNPKNPPFAHFESDFFCSFSHFLYQKRQCTMNYCLPFPCHLGFLLLFTVFTPRLSLFQLEEP